MYPRSLSLRGRQHSPHSFRLCKVWARLPARSVGHRNRLCQGKSGLGNNYGRTTGNPEVIRSSVGLVPTNALVATELSTSIDWPETGFWEIATAGLDRWVYNPNALPVREAPRSFPAAWMGGEDSRVLAPRCVPRCHANVLSLRIRWLHSEL